MLRHYYRLLFPVAVALLAIPLLVEVLAPPAPSLSYDELRILAPPPATPRRLAELPDFLRQADGWMRDHFGLRRFLIHQKSLLVSLLLRSGNDNVLIASNNWFFLLNFDESMAKAAGVIVRPEGVAETAGILVAMQHVLAARGTKLLVASPPGASTIYPEELPGWARKPGYPTQYDLLYAALIERGVPVLDLRPVLRAEKPHGHVYRMHDSHWAPRGALAAFNAIVASSGLPSWQMSPEVALAPMAPVRGGDLARFLGVAADEVEDVEQLAVPLGEYHQLNGDFIPAGWVAGSRSGPTIMVIGDSFSREWISNLVAAHAGKLVWLHHQQCNFDWKWVDMFKPNQVWYLPNERDMLCLPGSQPMGLHDELVKLDALTSRN
jgi:hypothetical protein